MATVKLKDKRSGLTYVYDSHSRRDKETGKIVTRRTLIGRLDPETGEIVPTDGRGRRRGEDMPATLSGCKQEIRRLRKEVERLEARISEMEGRP